MQLIVSIQALILVAEPYYNEPGYEYNINTANGQAESLKYSRRIQQATVQWAMLAQLKSPDPIFAEVWWLSGNYSVWQSADPHILGRSQALRVEKRSRPEPGKQACIVNA